MLYYTINKIINLPLFLFNLLQFKIQITKINYNYNFGLEDYNKEYKQFTLIYNIPLEIEEAKKYCKTNKLLPYFNYYILQNLYIYIKIFLQKNIFAFLNANIIGNFYIGIDDNGDIKGIPYNGKLPIYFLYLYIHFIFYFYNNNNDVYKYININFIEVLTKNYHIKNNLIFENYLIDEKYYLNIFNIYKENYNNWIYNYKLFSRKLADLANDNENRKKIINYIKKNTLKFERKVLNIFYSSYKFENKNSIEIKNINNDKNNPYYWITRWKDEICYNLLKKKPIKPSCLHYYDKIKSIPFRLINCLELIPYWLKYNKNLKLYIININIKKHNTNNKYQFNNKFPIRSLTTNNIPYVKII